MTDHLTPAEWVREVVGLRPEWRTARQRVNAVCRLVALGFLLFVAAIVTYCLLT